MNQCEEILTQIKKAFVGKKDVARKILMTMLAGGHVLLEDIPGVGKTTLAVAFSNATDLQYKRIQFTPTCCRRILRDFRSFTAKRERWNTSLGPRFATCCWQMKSTALPPARSLRCWRRWKKEASRWTV